MPKDTAAESIPLPKGWPDFVKSSVLHVISLAKLAIINVRGRAAYSWTGRFELAVELEQARETISHLLEELTVGLITKP